jgi:hypothetical protein
MGPPPGPGIRAAADDDGRTYVAPPAHGFEELDPVHFRHMDIKDQAVALAGPASSEKLSARRERACLVAFAFQQDLKRIPYCLIIGDLRKRAAGRYLRKPYPDEPDTGAPAQPAAASSRRLNGGCGSSPPAPHPRAPRRDLWRSGDSQSRNSGTIQNGFWPRETRSKLSKALRQRFQ